MTRSSSDSNDGDPPDDGIREPTTGSSILLVNDEADVRAVLARSLEGEGYVVKQADGAAEALDEMISEPASVVLCDIRTPAQEGVWLAGRLHKHWPEIPIVLATALDDFQTMPKSHDLGAVHYIAKPIAPDQLLEVVRRVTATPALPEVVAAAAIQPDEPPRDNIDAEYALETAVRCPACGHRIETLKAVRLIRARVNFTSTLPRRGRVIACPRCLAIVPAELTNF